jgi:hypothetical protein
VVHSLIQRTVVAAGASAALLVPAVALAGPVAALPSNCAESGSTVTCTFAETGAPVAWPAPAGVTSAALTLYGGSGGTENGASGGAGAEVTGTVSLSGISALTLNVAGAGGGGLHGSGGYGGGGTAGGNSEDGGGGGGATTVADSAGTLLVAGGGGGAGEGDTSVAGGNGGNAGQPGQAGQAATAQGATANGGGGGGAGTQTAGGAGGPGGGGTSTSTCSAFTGSHGVPGSSGQGGGIPPANQAGAAGGGGYFGGGQGGEGSTLVSLESDCSGSGGNGGGGGGSSFTGGAGVSAAAVNDSPGAPAALGGNGEVIISYTVLAVATASLPAATGGRSYTATLAAAGGVTPYSWSVPAGTLPAGLTLSTAGVISGIPDVAGTGTFTVTVTDAENPPMTATGVLSITVSGPAVTGLRPGHGPSFGGSLVKITGTGLSCPRHQGFSCRVGVSFGGHRAFIQFTSPTAIWVIAPPGRGTVPVTVNVGGVSSQATAAGQFTYDPGRFLL